MTDGDALLAAILANPACDSVRLVYADWLQENGQEERAEFIRVQVELAVLEPLSAYFFTGEPERVHFDVLRNRSNQLLALHGDEWVPRVPAMWGWERGFVGHIRGIFAADWLAHADAILAAHPVRKVRLTTAPPTTQLHSPTLGGPPFRILEAAWSHDGEPFMFTEDGQLKAELQRKWEGVEFELPEFYWWTSGGVVSAPIAPGATVAPGDMLTVNEQGHAVPTSGANYAAAVAAEQSWNAVVGGILTNMITQDGLLPGGDDDADEDEDDTDVVAE